MILLLASIIFYVLLPLTVKVVEHCLRRQIKMNMS